MIRFGPSLLAVALLPGAALAQGEHVEIASAGDEGDPFDLYVTLNYRFERESAAIKREFVGFPGTDPDGPIPIVKDLVFDGSHHVLTPKLSMGIWQDIALSAALPIILSDGYTLSFDEDTDARNSTTIQDGLLPATGFDADDPTGPGFTDPSDPTIFRGTTRSGLDQLHLGLSWAPMNQRRDDTKPTWIIGAELRLAVGAQRQFDRLRPGEETGIGRGLHETRLWTSVAKRTSWAIPFVELWWQAPIGTTGGTTNGSGFIDVGFGERRNDAQQLAGTRFGFEGIVWQDLEAQQRVGLEFSTRVEAHFEGRAYTPMWEVFALAGEAGTGGPLVIDADPTEPGLQALSHPGVTNVENYLAFAGRMRVNARIGEYVQFAAGFELLHDQQHIITFADAGVDLPRCSGGNTVGCEPDANDTVDPGTPEVNPYHIPTIDANGHRYRIEESFDWALTTSALIMF